MGVNLHRHRFKGADEWRQGEASCRESGSASHDGDSAPAGSSELDVDVPSCLTETGSDLCRRREIYRWPAAVCIARSTFERRAIIEAETGSRRAPGVFERTGRGKRDAFHARLDATGWICTRKRRADAIAMFETFLKKYPDDKRWTPDAMFRLAELYYEKSSEEFLVAQEEFQKALDSPNPPDIQPPKVDYAKTVDLYKRLLTDFPNYRLLDAAYYLLRFCLADMGLDNEAKQALLALTCANKYKPLDVTTAVPAGMEPARSGNADVYKTCAPVRKNSKFLAEGWTRIGEMHFDNGELAAAISAYGQVLNFRWEEAGPMLMSCLIGSDLDNYARLTCLWGRESGAAGLEAMFPVK